VNDWSQIGGEYTDVLGVQHGYTYRDGVLTRLNDPYAGTRPGQGTVPNGANNLGVIVGFYVDTGGGYHGFELTPR
jgi:hypothetical protein